MSSEKMSDLYKEENEAREKKAKMNEAQEKIEVKSNKHNYGLYLAIFLSAFLINKAIIQNTVKPDQTLLHFFSFLVVSIDFIAGLGFWVCLILWIVDLTRRRKK